MPKYLGIARFSTTPIHVSRRAEKAELNVGDEFLWADDPASEHSLKDMLVKIRRDGQEPAIQYRPESFQNVTIVLVGGERRNS